MSKTASKPTRSVKPETTPYYPPYVPSPTGARTLAYLVGHTITFERHVDASTGEVLSPGGLLTLDEWNWQTLSDAIYSHNLQLWCDDIEQVLADLLPYALRQCFATPDERASGKQWCQVHLDPDQGNAIYGITIRRGRMRRHINVASRWIDAERWEIAASSEEENRAWMRRIRWLCATLGTGIKGTPASVGEHVIRTSWPRDETSGRIAVHTRPILPCIEALERWSIGSRMELYATPGITLDVAYRADMSGAYPSFAGRLPGGHVGYLSGRESISARFLAPYDGSPPALETATWFARCIVELDAPGTPAGDVLPFAYKKWNAAARAWDIVWPTAPGTYGRREDEQLWLWREQAEAIQRLARVEGVPIRIAAVGEAYVWNEWTHQLRPWAERMDQARREAPGPREAKLVKLATVAGFGRLGMQYHERVLVSDRDGKPGEEYLSLQSGEDDVLYYIRRQDTDPGTPKHWHAYVLAMCNLAMSQAMHDYFRRTGRGPLSVYVDEFETPTYPGGHYDEREWRMGGWKTKVYHLYTPYKAGHIHTLEEQRMPGVDTWKKADLYRWGEQPGKRRKHLNEEAAAVQAAPMTRERFLEIQRTKIAPWYAMMADNEAREAARMAQLRTLADSAERQMEREAWKSPKWGKNG